MSLSSEQLERIRSACEYDDYIRKWQDKDTLPMRGLDRTARKYRLYARYNLARRQTVLDSWRMSEGFRKAVLALEGPQLWLMISEDWCIDSAYSLPIIRAAQVLRDDIDLHILSRDENPDIMDLFLTNGSRSIPVFLAMTPGGDVLFRWGPQPRTLRNIGEDLKGKGMATQVVSQATIEWYDDEGWMDVESELADAFELSVVHKQTENS